MMLPDNYYQQFRLENLRTNSCYIRKQSNGITAFYKVEKIIGTTIYALAQIVQKNNPKNTARLLYSNMYEWNGKHFNSSLQDFPCSQTPNLSNTAYLKRCGYIKGLRGEFICEPERQPALFQEKEFSNESFKNTLFNN